MPDSIFLALQYGGYLSSVKLVVFGLFAFASLPLIAWIHHDALAVRTRANLWSGIVFAAAAVGLLVWLLIPLFAIGLAFFLLAVGAGSVAYVVHRNSRVSPFERVLTVDHIKGLFANQEKQAAAVSKGMAFITANKNEVEPPPPKTPEYYGYKFATKIFEDAIWRRASDVTLAPAASEYNIAYRIDGVSFKQPPQQRDETEYFVRFIKHLADLDVNEKRKPQKGRFTVVKDSDKTVWEVTTAGSTTGEQVQLRQAEQYDLMNLEEIGLAPDQLEQIQQIVQPSPGIFLVSGPPRTGVTTTFYSLLKNHDPFIYNINTLERNPPVELMNITQNVFTLTDTGTTTFAKKLQSVLRTDPDILGISDCRDAESAKLACSGAQRGKRVYVSFQAGSTLQALGIWLKWIEDKKLAVDTLIGISNQRLLRKICPECKEAYQPNQQLLKKFNIPADKAKLFYRPAQLYDKRGRPITCQNCQGTGYVGRTGVFEIIILNEELKKAILGAASLQEIGSQFRRARMLYLQEQAIRKVTQGVTSINEVIREFSASSKKQKQRSQKG